MSDVRRLFSVSEDERGDDIGVLGGRSVFK